MIDAKNLTVSYEDQPVLRDVSLRLDPTQVTAIIGPNGCGKSTLLRALSGIQPRSSGTVHLDGNDIARLNRRSIARALALLPQSPTAPAGLSVRQLVEHGRFAHSRPFAGLAEADHAAVDAALDHTQTAPWADRAFDALSGGERQRVWIALALAQAPRMLLLDEPTSYLDMGHQEELLRLLTRLHRETGLGLAMVLHDLNQASRFADRVVVMQAGQIIADGPPDQVLTPALINQLYGLRVQAHHDSLGAPIFLPFELGLGRAARS